MAERWSGFGLVLAVSAAAVLGLSAPSCLARRDDAQKHAGEGRCASCHGDPSRDGDFLSRAAPPFDLLGQDRPAFPGVGAHLAHLVPGPSHAAVACGECHVVPRATDDPGHADDARPAEVVFGALARGQLRSPRYEPEVRTCSDSYCHGEYRPLWNEPRPEACGTCHGLPPAAPHAQSDDCAACHGEVIDAERRFKHPERHVDGIVDVTTADCRNCHGNDDGAAPPRDTRGNSDTSQLGVGAHQVHLAGGEYSRPLECEECHRVPDAASQAAHVDGLPAELDFDGVALAGERIPVWDRSSATCSETHCHAPSPGDSRRSPLWTGAAGTSCGSCHGMPPPAPHPALDDCSQCHGAVIAEDDSTIIERQRHVDGHVDLAPDFQCTSCHGNADPAPPRDLSGNDSSELPGVGAHRTHVAGSARARAVPCGECHEVPVGTFDRGHLDSDLPAELSFSGAAVAFGATPEYDGVSCGMTACHGAVFPRGHDSGGSHTRPVWTKVDGTEASCGSCHGLPPPAPHPLPTYPCHQCHENVAADDVTFTRPELHVDGVVTLRLP